jgi:SMC interacting uncharacterized protein involved in chromosome segregation
MSKKLKDIKKIVYKMNETHYEPLKTNQRNELMEAIKQVLEDVATLTSQNATLSSNLSTVIKDSNKLMSANLSLQSKLDKIEEVVNRDFGGVNDLYIDRFKEIKQIL